MFNYTQHGVDLFLDRHPGMRLGPIIDNHLVLEGLFRFNAVPVEGRVISDSFELKILVPKSFPKEIPIIFETGGEIPPHPDYHINSTDNSLCLGTALRIMMQLEKNSTLLGFSNDFLLPYLYAVSMKLNSGGEFAFGELAHGSQGILQDYGDLLKLDSLSQIKNALILLGTKKRNANKKPCPCGCGRRYGVCNYRSHLEQFRNLSNSKWFLLQANNILL